MKKNSEKEISNFEKEKKGKETRKGEEQIPQAPAIEPPTTSSIEPPSSLVQQPKTMAHYWNLASIDQNTRTLAVHDLLADLKVFKAEHDLQESKEKIELFTTYQDVKDHCAPDVSYAFKRLIRGLSSSRDGARQGFSVALTEVSSIIIINSHTFIGLKIDSAIISLYGCCHHSRNQREKWQENYPRNS